MAGSVKVNDRKWLAIKKRLLQATSASHVKVGLIGSKGGGEQTDGGFTIVEIGSAHEFGAPRANIPQRSFIRKTFEDQRSELIALQAKVSKAIILKGLKVSKALEVLGQWGAAEVKKTITAGPHLEPPNEASTVARKGSDRPLVDTGRMVQAITHEVKL